MNKTRKSLRKAFGMKKALVAFYLLAALVIGAAGMNATTMTVLADSSEAAAIVSRIDALPTLEDLTDSYATEVYNIMNAYRNLPHVDKLEVTNIEKLQRAYNKLLTTGAIIDTEADAVQRQIEEQQMRNAMEVSGAQASQAIEYTFASDGNTDGVASIIIRYTSDVNGDGKGDIPERMVLTSPTNVSTPVTNAAVAMKDSTMDIALTWADSFVQMDIAYAQQGKWTISTSTPVSFSLMNYAGVRLDITSENEKLSKDDVTEVTELADGVIEEEEEPEKSSMGSTILIVLLVLGLGGIGFFYFKGKNAGTASRGVATKKGKGKAQVVEEEEMPHVQSEEEIIAEMKAEYQRKQEMLMSDDDEDLFQEEKKTEFTQADIDEEATIEEYEEGFSKASAKAADAEEASDEDFFAESSARFA